MVKKPESRTCDSPKGTGGLPRADFDLYLRMLKALGHPVRLKMVDLINGAGGEICVCQFEKYFDLKQPTISHHLKILRDAGLIRSRQDASWVRHSIEPAAFTHLRDLVTGFSQTGDSS